MSILNIKERFSQRILESEKETKDPILVKNVRQFTQNSIHEVDVGITEYVSDLLGFHAVIKQRYSDFNVHEIDKEGKLVVLDSYELPDESLSEEVLDTTLIEDSVLQDLEYLVDNDNAPTVNSVTIDVTDKSKEERKSIHQFVKAKYGAAVLSNTSEEDQRKIITIIRNESGAKEKRRAGHLPKHLHFVLCKANLDTTNALGLIGSKLRLKVGSFNFAGTKDKRANTSQWVSIKNMYASRLKNVKNLRGIWMGNFIYKDYPLALGSLKGNNFQIALRDVSVSDEVIEDAFTKLKENGFINYFGLQRFGNSRESPTHEIGRQLIKEAFGQAVELILKPRGDGESPDMRSAREIWARTRDAGQALSALRNTRSIEARLLQGLKTSGTNAHVNALDKIPRNVRLLYLHAYQALLWNKVVSRRMATYGMTVLEGDLVFIAEEEENPLIEDIDGPEEEQIIVPDTKPLEKPCLVKEIKSEDIASYSIYDLVLPLPGCASVYPKNAIADWYRELLAEDGLTTESLGSRVRQYSLQGSYRKILKKPNNVSWKIVRYEKPEDDLILSDPDKLEGRTLSEEEGSLRAIVLSLDLDPCTYATMALREVLRADTSVSNQTQLNNGSKRPGAITDNVEVKRLKVEGEDRNGKIVDDDGCVKKCNSE